MCDVLPSIIVTRLLGLRQNTRLIFFYSRAQIQVGLCFYCWQVLSGSFSALSLYLCILSTLQLLNVTFPFFFFVKSIGHNRKFLTAFAIDFVASAVAINWIYLETATKNLHFAFDLYGVWVILTWFYALVVHNMILSFLAVVIYLLKNGYTTAEENDAETSSQDGANSEDLEQTVVRRFLQHALNPVQESRRSTDERCSVCLCDYAEDDEVRDLPCMHSFHRECIDQWLSQHRRCPICRLRPSAVVQEEDISPDEPHEILRSPLENAMMPQSTNGRRDPQRRRAKRRSVKRKRERRANTSE